MVVAGATSMLRHADVATRRRCHTAQSPLGSVPALPPTGGAYQARLTFHRTDLPPPLDWTVVATIALTPQ
jgi:hypothetical protein